MSAITVLALSFIAVPFVLYPLVLWMRARLASSGSCSGATLPDVDLVICAFNEADSITQKISNALSLDYPKEKLTIWVASDGSTDDTVAKAQAAGGDRVVVLDLPRAGKASALNTAVAAGSAEVVAFSDANSEWKVNALRELVAPLADPAVGGVAGDQRYHNATAGAGAEDASGERGYWNFDRALKRWQSQAGSATSATGAIYCVRRALFEPAPADATDDFMISTAVIAAGYRLAFAPDAQAFEPPARSTGLEFRRKVRVMSRGLRGVYYRRALLNPKRTGLYALQLLIHKLWRRLVWIPSVILLICAPAALLQGGFPMLVAAGVLAVSVCAAAGFALPGLRKHKLFSVCSYVVMVNLASAVATFNLLRGNRISQWHLPRDVSDAASRSLDSPG